MDTSDERLIAGASELVLNRLEAWLEGDQQKVARIDAAAHKDSRSQTAMFAAAFGFAERSLNVLRQLDEDELQPTGRIAWQRRSGTSPRCAGSPPGSR